MYLPQLSLNLSHTFNTWFGLQWNWGQAPGVFTWIFRDLPLHLEAGYFKHRLIWCHYFACCAVRYEILTPPFWATHLVTIGIEREGKWSRRQWYLKSSPLEDNWSFAGPNIPFLLSTSATTVRQTAGPRAPQKNREKYLLQMKFLPSLWSDGKQFQPTNAMRDYLSHPIFNNINIYLK